MKGQSVKQPSDTAELPAHVGGATAPRVDRSSDPRGTKEGDAVQKTFILTIKQKLKQIHKLGVSPNGEIPSVNNPCVVSMETGESSM